jgi:hypothetical protein
MLLSGIQFHDKRIMLAVFLDSRYAVPRLHQSLAARMSENMRE